MCIIGEKIDDIIKSFFLLEADMKKYKVVNDKFKSHVVKRHNTIYNF